MSREFFDQIDDEVRGMVPAELSNPTSYRSGRLIKLWYRDPAIHFEAQVLSARWSGRDEPCLEVGLHLEAASAARNDLVLDELVHGWSDWRAALPRAEWGRAIGPRAATWRRVSEILVVPGWDEDVAGEVAERLAGYVAALALRLQARL